MRIIPVWQDREAIVDNADYDLLIQYPWHMHHEYAVTTLKVYLPNKRQTEISMQNMLFNLANGMELDHVDGNKLNNQRQNLRICTHADNCKNRGMRSDSQSGRKGVSPIPGNKWRATINIGGKNIHLGCLSSIDEASDAYDRAATSQYGEFARTNAFLEKCNPQR
jgi:hypothetical protein